MKIYILMFKNVEIGYIRENLFNDLEFEYSAEFKSLNLAPLPNFPDPNKRYKKPAVLSFLFNRIPTKILKSKQKIVISELIMLAKKVAHSPVEII